MTGHQTLFRGNGSRIWIKARCAGGSVETSVRASNLVMDGVNCPIVVNPSTDAGAGQTGVTDSPFSPWTMARRVSAAFATATSLPCRSNTLRRTSRAFAGMFVEDLVIENSLFYLDAENRVAASPTAVPDVGEHCCAGIIARNVQRFSLRHVDLADQLGPAITVADVRDEPQRPVASHQHPDAMIQLTNISRGVITACDIPQGVEVGLRLSVAHWRRDPAGRGTSAGSPPHPSAAASK